TVGKVSKFQQHGWNVRRLEHLESGETMGVRRDHLDRGRELADERTREANGKCLCFAADKVSEDVRHALVLMFDNDTCDFVGKVFADGLCSCFGVRCLVCDRVDRGAAEILEANRVRVDRYEQIRRMLARNAYTFIETQEEIAVSRQEHIVFVGIIELLL